MEGPQRVRETHALKICVGATQTLGALHKSGDDTKHTGALSTHDTTTPAMICASNRSGHNECVYSDLMSCSGSYVAGDMQHLCVGRELFFGRVKNTELPTLF
jgi:hypothetical protein